MLMKSVSESFKDCSTVMEREGERERERGGKDGSRGRREEGESNSRTLAFVLDYVCVRVCV